MAVEITLPVATLIKRGQSGGPPAPPQPPQPPSGGGGGSSGDGSSSGGSSSSGSSSSSSGSSAPPEPQDPYTKWYGDLSPVDQKRVSIFDSVYQELWGEPAPLAVLQSAVNQGLNRWEFEEAQKRNPAWWHTEAAQDQVEPLDNFLISLGLDPVYRRGGKKGGGKNKPGDKQEGMDQGKAKVPGHKKRDHPFPPVPNPIPKVPGGESLATGA